MANISGTNLAAPVVPFTTDDFFPTHLAQYGKGGWRSVNTLADRDAITDARLELGMSVYVVSEQTLYVLTSLDTTTTPYTKTWSEFKAGSTDSVRKTEDFSTFEPLFNGEIVEYIGTTTQNYTNGYFYQVHTEIIPESVNVNVVIGEDLSDVAIDSQTFLEYAQPTESATWTFEYNEQEGSWCLNNDPEQATDLADWGVSYTSTGSDPESGDIIEIVYTQESSVNVWNQKNVQPDTPVINDVDHTDTDKALSANMGYELNQRINALEGRGRFLSGWNCVTGLAETDPDINPYPYKAGDYYVVSNAVKAEPESCTAHASQTEGWGWNPFYYKQYVQPTADRTDVFTYTNVSNTPNENNRGEEQVAIIDESKFRETYDHLYDLAVELEQDPDRHIVSADGFKVRWFDYMDTLYITANIVCTKTNLLEPAEEPFEEDVQLPNGNISSRGLTLAQKQAAIRDFYLENYGLLITGDIYVGNATWFEEIFVSTDDTEGGEPAPATWKHNGIALEDGESINDYGIFCDNPVAGMVITVEFISEKINYRPNGSQYEIGVASTTIETSEVFNNDTYIYDGENWTLVSGYQPITFAGIAGDPYDNAALSDALNSKLSNISYNPETEELIIS